MLLCVGQDVKDVFPEILSRNFVHGVHWILTKPKKTYYG